MNIKYLALTLSSLCLVLTSNASALNNKYVVADFDFQVNITNHNNSYILQKLQNLVEQQSTAQDGLTLEDRYLQSDIVIFANTNLYSAENINKKKGYAAIDFKAKNINNYRTIYNEEPSKAVDKLDKDSKIIALFGINRDKLFASLADACKLNNNYQLTTNNNLLQPAVKLLNDDRLLACHIFTQTANKLNKN